MLLETFQFLHSGTNTNHPFGEIQIFIIIGLLFWRGAGEEEKKNLAQSCQYI